MHTYRSRVRAWFADNWLPLGMAALLALVPTLKFVGGPILGVVVFAVCSSIDLNFGAAMWIGTVTCFATCTLALWMFFNWIRGYFRRPRGTRSSDKSSCA